MTFYGKRTLTFFYYFYFWFVFINDFITHISCLINAFSFSGYFITHLLYIYQPIVPSNSYSFILLSFFFILNMFMHYPFIYLLIALNILNQYFFFCTHVQFCLSIYLLTHSFIHSSIGTLHYVSHALHNYALALLYSLSLSFSVSVSLSVSLCLSLSLSLLLPPSLSPPSPSLPLSLTLSLSLCCCCCCSYFGIGFFVLSFIFPCMFLV